MSTIRIPGPHGMLVIHTHGRPDQGRPRALYLMLNGWGPGLVRFASPMDLQARWLCDRADVLTATAFLTGMGSPGRVAGLTRADFLRQVIAVHDRLAEHPGVSEVNVAGESFGAYLAVLLSARRPLARLVLRVPTDVDPAGFDTRPQTDFAGDKGLAWKSAHHTSSDSPALAAAASFTGRTWLVSAGRDQIVPWQTTQNYLDALPPDRTHHVHLPRTGHAMVGHLLAFRSVLTEAATSTA